MFFIPIEEIHPISWEGEITEKQKLIVIKCCKSATTPKGKVSFVLAEEDILHGRIAVRMIARLEDKALVQPVAEYIPHLWGLAGIPPKQFLVPVASLNPA
jgi:hypothetical protein